MSERQLRRFETAVLGPEHAAEHARIRSVTRRYGAARPARATPPLAARTVSPSVGGRWQPAFRIPVIGINAVMLPTGKVMWFAYPVNANPKYGDPNAPNTAMAWLWDPARRTFKRVDPPLWRDPADGKLKPANIWCGAQTLTADGRVIVAGGNLAYRGSNPNFKGLDKVYSFDPWNETWTEQPDMEDGRWYPTEVRLADGRVLIIGGLDSSGNTYSSNLAIDLLKPSADLDGRGTLTTLGLRGGAGAPPDGGLYPHLFWMPSGRVMVAGPNQPDSWLLHDPTGSNVFGWDDIAAAGRRRHWGSAVLLPDGPAGSTKVELVGGSDPIDHPPPDPPTNGQATNTTETYDESSPPASPWQPAAPLSIGRSHLNTVLLPDSSMVTVGGGIGTVGDNQWAVDANGDQRQVELYNPTTDAWTLGAAQSEARAYHSTALLMPDARVISAGDDYNGSGGPGTGVDKDTAEIYEPPYLFKSDGTYAPRPRISSAPGAVSYGEPSFHVGTPDNVVKASLVAPGATTHANDMNQRVVPLALSKTAGGVDLAPPPSADVAPPGNYMLFLIDDKGVPSLARWVLLGENPPPAGRIEVAQRTLPASASRFSFSGPPFDGLGLANGGVASASLPGGPSTTVPGGHYRITQGSARDYDLVAVDCSDSDSTTSVATRSARVNLAAGETVRCTFTDRRRPATEPGGPNPTFDEHGPTIAFGRLNAHRGTLSGRVKDASGVKRVDVALAARRARRCRWWSPRRRRFARRRRSCGRPVFMRARLRRSGSGYTFRLALHRRIGRGRYLVALKAVDKRGNVTIRSGHSAVRVAVRR